MTQAEEDAVLGRLLGSGDAPGVAGSVVSYGPGPDQVVEVFGEGGPCVVVVHGGYFRPSIDRAHARPVAAALAAGGWTVALLEYRRVPGDPSVTVADLASADAELRRAGRRPDVWLGHSAGGTLVLLRALMGDRPPVAAVALAPVADVGAAIRDRLGEGAVAAWVGDTDPGLVDPVALLGEHLAMDGSAAAGGSAAARVSAAAAVSAVVGRVRVLHGDRDATVPLSQSSAWAAAGGEVEVVEGAHHFDLIDPDSAAWPRVVSALDRADRSSVSRARRGRAGGCGCRRPRR